MRPRVSKSLEKQIGLARALYHFPPHCNDIGPLGPEYTSVAQCQEAREERAEHDDCRSRLPSQFSANRLFRSGRRLVRPAAIPWRSRQSGSRLANKVEAVNQYATVIGSSGKGTTEECNRCQSSYCCAKLVGRVANYYLSRQFPRRKR